MDNERHAIENSRKHVRMLVKPEAYQHVYDLIPYLGLTSNIGDVFMGSRRIKAPSEPPSQKPIELRDEHDYRRLAKAKERNERRAAKRLKQFGK